MTAGAGFGPYELIERMGAGGMGLPGAAHRTHSEAAMPTPQTARDAAAHSVPIHRRDTRRPKARSRMCGQRQIDFDDQAAFRRVRSADRPSMNTHGAFGN